MIPRLFLQLYFLSSVLQRRVLHSEFLLLLLLVLYYVKAPQNASQGYCIIAIFQQQLPCLFQYLDQDEFVACLVPLYTQSDVQVHLEAQVLVDRF